ncbi:MAG: CRISPR-associated ring nuclease Csm6 [Acetobacteraceae bacterium]
MPNPVDPASYSSRILLAVTGLSPQILTETLYALVVQGQPAFVPTRIEVLTTTAGRRLAIRSLLAPESGAFLNFCREYGISELAGALTGDSIQVMSDNNGRPLADIRTLRDSATAADAIVARVRALTGDPECALHVSIAGGRKTMGFLAGHALSLFGRPQDRLSHVLVAEPFLTLSDFFFPPREPRSLHDRAGALISTADADLTLAEIPFLRLREHLPPGIQAPGRAYTETIALAQAALDPMLEIDLRRRFTRFGGRALHLPPAELAWLAWMAERRRDPALPHGGALHWTEMHPPDLFRLYARVAAPKDVDRLRRALAKDDAKTLFEQRTAKLNKLVRDGLGPAAAPYMLRSDRHRPRSRTGLTLSPERIWLTL